MYCWVDGGSGRLGHKDMECRQTPHLVSVSIGRITQGLACAAHTAALSVDGALVMFGAAGFGELGLGDRRPRLEPTLIPTRSFVSDYGVGKPGRGGQRGGGGGGGGEVVVMVDLVLLRWLTYHVGTDTLRR
jgi:hypothetical protein